VYAIPFPIAAPSSMATELPTLGLAASRVDDGTAYGFRGVGSMWSLTMQLSDAEFHQRQTKAALYPNHLTSPWLTEDATAIARTDG
jgi:hypothetical protein